MRTLTLLLILCGLSIGSQAREITIAAKVKQASSSKIAFSYVLDPIIEETKVATLNLDANGAVYFILNVKNTNVITVEYGKEKFDIYIEDEDKIDFEFDATNINTSLKFKGKGAVHNNFLNTYRQQFKATVQKAPFEKGYLAHWVDYAALQMASTSSLEQFLKSVQVSFKTQHQFLKTEQGLSEDFRDFMHYKIDYSTATHQLSYFVINQEKYTPEEIRDRAAQLNILQAIEVQNDLALKHPDYLNFLATYTHFLFLKKSRKDPKASFAFYEIIDKSFIKESKAWMLTKLLINAKKENNTSLAAQKFASFKSNTTYSKYVKMIEQFYGDELAVELDPEGMAPNFSFYDTKQQLRSLQEFKGKVVYISFWATWCKPCLMGFKKTIHVRRQLQDLGVVLLNVSLDDSDGLWKRTMARVPMPGVNIRSGNDKKLKVNYDLSKLPSYYIINKAGKFAYLPEETRDILAEFEKLVKE